MKRIGYLFFAILLVFGKSYGEWKRVYLASFPRSGNHWVRYLVEDASGIATGSVYQDRDPYHMERVFPWGGYCAPNGYRGLCRYPHKGEAVLIKTHYPFFEELRSNPFDNQPSVKTIRIVRHPVDSIYSHYVYDHKRKKLKYTSHISKRKLMEYISLWKENQEYWNGQPNVLTILYEDIYKEPHRHLKTVLDVLDYKVTEEDIERAVLWNPPEGKLGKYFHYFHAEDIALIKKELSGLIQQFGYQFPK
jgi:hypothetical protein